MQFGSTVSGRTHSRSDLDLGALFEEGEPSLERRGQLELDLQGAFRGRQIDLAVLNHADPLFLKKILEGGRRLAGSPRRLAELRMYAYRRYQDHRRFLDLERRYVGRFVEERSRP